MAITIIMLVITYDYLVRETPTRLLIKGAQQCIKVHWLSRTN